MIDAAKKRNRQLAFELQNSHVCEKRSKFEKSLPNIRKESRCLVFMYPIKLKLGCFTSWCIRAANSPTIKFCAEAFSFQGCSCLKCFSGKAYRTVNCLECRCSLKNQ